MGGAHLESTTIRRLESRQNPHAGKRALRSLSRLYLFSVAQIANLPYRRLQWAAPPKSGFTAGGGSGIL